MNLSDIEIEVLLFGKWRFNTDWENIFIEFKQDMTYEQTKIQTFILSKPSELIVGNKFIGVWYINDARLCLIPKSVPKSIFNFQLPILPRVYLADIITSITSAFITEKYEVIEVNRSRFLISDVNKSFVGIKIS
ncbi:hypothetical protein [Nostoc sp. PA-18-2419]|uniref:hypothetical protein n=1 Tax=Nostoc sp. PA-18-2419 TaxID=2575443 RepID=UPI001108F6AA|nr:hypothetical protein [Nostoc sp. PA-18-2419]